MLHVFGMIVVAKLKRMRVSLDVRKVKTVAYVSVIWNMQFF